MTQDLINGAAEFKRYHYDGDNELMSELVKVGQNPKYFIIACIDSRCNPNTVFRAKPGSFLSHKAMGAIVRPYKQGTALAAALQFALEHNRIETIIVLGHTNCGAIKALVDETDDPEISSFVNVARHALTKAKSCCDTQDAVIAQTEREIILESAENIKSYPSVAKALAERRAVIKAWQFDMNDGNLLEYDEEEKDFIILNNAAHTQDSRQE